MGVRSGSIGDAAWAGAEARGGARGEVGPGGGGANSRDPARASSGPYS